MTSVDSDDLQTTTVLNLYEDTASIVSTGLASEPMTELYLLEVMQNMTNHIVKVIVSQLILLSFSQRRFIVLCREFKKLRRDLMQWKLSELLMTCQKAGAGTG